MTTKEELKKIHDMFMTFLQIDDPNDFRDLDGIQIDNDGFLVATYSSRYDKWSSSYDPSVLTKDLEEVTKDRIIREEKERIEREENWKKEQIVREEREKNNRWKEYQKLKKEFES